VGKKKRAPLASPVVVKRQVKRNRTRPFLFPPLRREKKRKRENGCPHTGCLFARQQGYRNLKKRGQAHLRRSISTPSAHDEPRREKKRKMKGKGVKGYIRFLEKRGDTQRRGDCMLSIPYTYFYTRGKGEEKKKKKGGVL